MLALVDRDGGGKLRRFSGIEVDACCSTHFAMHGDVAGKHELPMRKCLGDRQAEALRD
jgi:hypothetical protein